MFLLTRTCKALVANPAEWGIQEVVRVKMQQDFFCFLFLAEAGGFSEVWQLVCIMSSLRTVLVSVVGGGLPQMMYRN